MKCIRQCLLLIVVPVMLMDTASGIIRRHDVDDARYLELGARFSAVTRVGGATGTLVAPEWILTAAHVVENMSPFERGVMFGGQNYQIVAVAMHPQAEADEERQRVDLALVRLDRPVEGVTPVAFYERDDERDKEIVFVGIGMFGNGLTGPQGDDGRLRGATNTVRRVLDNWLVFRFDAPPEGTELEGISGPGDSGGPALIEIDGKLYVMGVSSANDPPPGAAGPCRYESSEYYARVSTYLGWLREAMEQTAVGEGLGGGRVVDLTGGAFPDTPAGRIATAFFAAYAADDPDRMREFEASWRSAAALRDRPIAQRLDAWKESRGKWGAINPTKYAEDGERTLHVLVHARKPDHWLAFRFMLQPGEANKLRGVAISGPVSVLE